MHPPNPRKPGDGHVRTLAQIVLQAQLDAAEALTAAIGDGRLNRARYQDWLAMESAACRIGALALDSVGKWHAANSPLQKAARAWAQEQREFAQLAASDVRAMDGFAAPPPPELGHWQSYITEVGQSQRAGEALGAAVLQASILRGPARDVLAAIATLPLAVKADLYLARRLQPDASALHPQRNALQNEYAAAALAAGARRAANWALPCAEATLGANAAPPA